MALRYLALRELCWAQENKDDNILAKGDFGFGT